MAPRSHVGKTDPPVGGPPDDFVMVGRILRPIGLDGQVKVTPLSDVPGRFDPGSVLWVLNVPPISVTVETVREGGRGDLVVGFENRSLDEVATWRGRPLAIAAVERPVLPDGSFYHDQLKGLEVWTESGERLGVLHDVWPTGPHDTWVIKASGSEQLLPAIRQVVVRVDLAAHRITVRPPLGWMDDETL